MRATPRTHRDDETVMDACLCDPEQRTAFALKAANRRCWSICRRRPDRRGSGLLGLESAVDGPANP